MSARRLILQFAFAVAVVIGASKESLATLSPIDSISLQGSEGYPETYSPVNKDYGLLVIGFPGVYHLHDGSSWQTGAGRFTPTYSMVSSVTESGNQISYTLDLPTGSLVFDSTDYGTQGLESSYGELVSTGPLVMTATELSNTASLSGYAEITANAPATNTVPDEVDLFDAPVGDLVPFNLTYQLINATWTPTVLDSEVQYSLTGTLDFAHAVAPEPTGTALAILVICGALMFRPRRKLSA